MLLALFATASCTSYKKVPYLQNSADFASVEADGLHEAKIMPQDVLSIIIVNPGNAAMSMMYNLVTPNPSSSTSAVTSQPALQNYIVANDGTVCIPTLGTVHVAGKTLYETEKYIQELVRGAFSTESSVVVRFVNFKISVLGEVAAPGTYYINNGRVNVLEALAMAHDMTVYGMRDNVKIIREDKNGKREIHEVDLNDANVLNSPYFYLQQNDVVYVTPNESKAKNSDIGSSTSLWFSATSILISLTSLMYNILK